MNDAENGKSKILYIKLQVNAMLLGNIYPTYRATYFLCNELTGFIFWNLDTKNKEITHRNITGTNGC
jgi:hypothetical protein